MPNSVTLAVTPSPSPGVSLFRRPCPVFMLVGKDLADVPLANFSGKRKIPQHLSEHRHPPPAPCRYASSTPKPMNCQHRGALHFRRPALCPVPLLRRRGLDNVITLSTLRGRGILRSLRRCYRQRTHRRPSQPVPSSCSTKTIGSSTANWCRKSSRNLTMALPWPYFEFPCAFPGFEEFRIPCQGRQLRRGSDQDLASGRHRRNPLPPLCIYAPGRRRRDVARRRGL